MTMKTRQGTNKESAAKKPRRSSHTNQSKRNKVSKKVESQEDLVEEIVSFFESDLCSCWVLAFFAFILNSPWLVSTSLLQAKHTQSTVLNLSIDKIASILLDEAEMAKNARGWRTLAAAWTQKWCVFGAVGFSSWWLDSLL